MQLERVQPGMDVGGIAGNAAVRIISIDWIGDQAISVAFRHPSSGLREIVLYRDDEPRLTSQGAQRAWNFAGDGANLRLLIEANRIALAHHFDPYLAIHTSRVDPLPHQISAVYGEMLPRQPLRFLLADDPGAGKTIMAGLLIRELIARGDLERCLIVAPGSLVEQGQDELGTKFDLEFDLLSRDMIEASRSGNPFEDRSRLIVRLDMLARNEELHGKISSASEWDLIVCDEAHRMAATFFGGEVKYTKRYQTGQMLSELCRHFLLMSATPHNGKEEDFQLFMALLDGDRFEGRFRDGVHLADTQDMMRRLTKEELLRFDGRPLFPERRSYTVRYDLTPREAALYEAVTEYVRSEMNRVERFTGDGKKRNAVGFALQILQRRLASSPAAIHRSLKRRRERLENELGEAQLVAKGVALPPTDEWDDFEEHAQADIDEMEDRFVSEATSAETVEQLTVEIGTLRRLEDMALAVLRSGEDTKWNQLSRILDNETMVDEAGSRRKLIVFTEPKDTLHYLAERVRGRLGRSDAVDVIHGGVSREERRKVIERFMQDRTLQVLIANDAAGEGVNLQRGHLMVNYDLPWNPNKIEQRFGRIHRIGQTEVCHLWNLVAGDTREGEVYARLLEKLERAREALGGRVYDVLGELFEGTPLRDLLFEAVREGERPEIKERLLRKVDGAVDQDKLLALLERRALTNDMMPAARVRELRIAMERAEAERLQPHHVQSFFVEAFERLGGRIKPREQGRWEIVHVPARLRERGRETGRGLAVRKSYERICFEKHHVDEQPVAAFICPGHPLLEAVIDEVRESNAALMKQGAVLIDDADDSEALRAVFLLEHAVEDERPGVSGSPHIVSQRLQFASILADGTVTDAGTAPHLDGRPATPEEIDLVRDALEADWLSGDLERRVQGFAAAELGRRHLKEVRDRRLPEVDKVAREVKARLTREINHWDARAIQLREDERAGKPVRLSSSNAQRRAEDLAERLQRRMAQIERERHLSASVPVVRGGFLMVPRGLLDARGASASRSPTGFAEDADARREIELAAMDAVMAAERALGNDPVDVSAQKVGYDIASEQPDGHLRFIEVKGRVDGADTVMVTRREIITSLNSPDRFILAVVPVAQGYAQAPRYVRGALTDREPGFLETAVQFNLNRLLERAGAPA